MPRRLDGEQIDGKYTVIWKPKQESPSESDEDFLERMEKKAESIQFDPNSNTRYCVAPDDAQNIMTLPEFYEQTSYALDIEKTFELCAQAQKPYVVSRDDLKRYKDLHPEMSEEEVYKKFSYDARVVPTDSEALYVDFAYNGLDDDKKYKKSIRDDRLAEKHTTNTNQEESQREAFPALYQHAVNFKTKREINAVFDKLGLTPYVQNKALIKSFPIEEQKEIALKLCDYISNNSKYTMSIQDLTQRPHLPTLGREQMSIYNVLCKGHGVCHDFSITLSHLLNEVGLENSYFLLQDGVPEFTTADSTHAAVVLDFGEEQKYVLDPTSTIRLTERAEDDVAQNKLIPIQEYEYPGKPGAINEENCFFTDNLTFEAFNKLPKSEQKALRDRLFLAASSSSAGVACNISGQAESFQIALDGFRDPIAHLSSESTQSQAERLSNETVGVGQNIMDRVRKCAMEENSRTNLPKSPLKQNKSRLRFR